MKVQTEGAAIQAHNGFAVILYVPCLNRNPPAVNNFQCFECFEQPHQSIH